MWVVTPCLVWDLDSHLSHLNFLSCFWIECLRFLWALRSLWLAALNSHKSQANGLILKCTTEIWLFKLPGVLVLNSHLSHWCQAFHSEFHSEWTFRLWSLNFSMQLKIFPHSSHFCTSFEASPWQFSMCLVSDDFWEKLELHSVQWYRMFLCTDLSW